MTIFVLGAKPKKDFKWVKMSLEKYLEKNGKRERAALAGCGLASRPLAESGPARPRNDAVARQQRSPPRGAHAPGWTHPGRPPGAPDRARLLPRCQTRSSTRSLALSHPRAAADRAAARHCRRRSEFLFPAAPASSLPSVTTSDSASPFRTQRSRSIALGKPRATVRAHWSESELRRPLGSRGSPSPLHHCLHFRAR